jgi:cytochrome c oxidase assembly protein subunit 15
MVLLALVLGTLLLVRRSRAPHAVLRRLTVLLAVLVAQAGIGYAQYFTGIPVLLVGIHIAGATALWAATVWFALGLTERPVVPQPVTDVTRPAPILTGAGERIR